MMDLVFPEDESCPDCGCTIFRPGPRGGAAQNIECARCKSRFNITRLPSLWLVPSQPRPAKMPIVWAQRIPSEQDGGGEWREDMFPRVLE